MARRICRPRVGGRGAHAHEDGRDEADDDLLEELPGELCGGDLVDEEPCGEEEADGEEDDRQVRVDVRVDGGDVAGHLAHVKLKGENA